MLKNFVALYELVSHLSNYMYSLAKNCLELIGFKRKCTSNESMNAVYDLDPGMIHIKFTKTLA